ncbi:hypothetical protein Tco_1343194 [Tanacetum coccineum]
MKFLRGILPFFLGLQVQQKEDGIFISQDKYVADILKKLDFVTVKTTSTPMEPNKALVKDEEAEDVDVHLYRSMIGSLILAWSKPRQEKPQHEVVISCAKVDFMASKKADYNSQILLKQIKEEKVSGNPSEPQPPPSTAQPTNEEPIPNIESSSPQKTQSPRKSLNKDTELPQTSVPIPNVPDEAVHQERGDSVERAATTATSLKAVQDSSNIAKTQSSATPTKPISQETSAYGGNIPRSDEDSMTLQELTALCTNRVLALETDLKQTNKVYGTAYTKLIMKVKKLEKTIKTSQARRRAKIVVSDDDMDSKDSSKQGRMTEEIDQDAGVTLVTPTKVSSQEYQPEDQLGVLSAAKALADAVRVHTYSRRRRAVSTGSGGVSIASRIVSNVGMIQQVNIIIPSLSATKDKGKAINTN